MLTILLVRQPRRLPKWILPVLDAVGLAVFVGIGVNKAFLAGSGPLVAVCMGVVTGVGGGIIRDVLARDFYYRPLSSRANVGSFRCQRIAARRITRVTTIPIIAEFSSGR